MSLKFKDKGTIFPQTRVQRNFPDNFQKLRKMLTPDDAAMFFMFADATCSTRPTADIEKIHVNVFKNSKILKPKLSQADLETLEILLDKELMDEIRESRNDAAHGRTISWDKVKTMV